uniref:NADH dehydrogenase [ubiquinone] 1 beta subcomplex subunit 6 n=1 Tax=Ciona savignyi TaxID=51511 RepID=H2YNY7_CIOSA
MNAAEKAKIIYKDIDRIVQTRSSGGQVSQLDEQRLRDYQIRRLRRLWLKDQILTAREPLLPPTKPSIKEKFQAAEDKFWGRFLKFRTLTPYLYLGSNLKEIPLLMLYKMQSSIRTYFFVYIPVALIPLYFMMNSNSTIPNITINEKPRVYPGEETFKARIGDVKINPLTGQYVRPE